MDIVLMLPPEMGVGILGFMDDASFISCTLTCRLSYTYRYINRGGKHPKKHTAAFEAIREGSWNLFDFWYPPRPRHHVTTRFQLLCIEAAGGAKPVKVAIEFYKELVFRFSKNLSTKSNEIWEMFMSGVINEDDVDHYRQLCEASNESLELTVTRSFYALKKESFAIFKAYTNFCRFPEAFDVELDKSVITTLSLDSIETLLECMLTISYSRYYINIYTTNLWRHIRLYVQFSLVKYDSRDLIHKWVKVYLKYFSHQSWGWTLIQNYVGVSAMLLEFLKQSPNYIRDHFSSTIFWVHYTPEMKRYIKEWDFDAILERLLSQVMSEDYQIRCIVNLFIAFSKTLDSETLPLIISHKGQPFASDLRAAFAF